MYYNCTTRIRFLSLDISVRGLGDLIEFIFCGGAHLPSLSCALQKLIRHNAVTVHYGFLEGALLNLVPGEIAYLYRKCQSVDCAGCHVIRDLWISKAFLDFYF